MSSNGTETETAVVPAPAPPAPVKKVKKYMNRPARKQVKPGEVEKKETPQTGKEYSEFFFAVFCAFYPSRDTNHCVFLLYRHLV